MECLEAGGKHELYINIKTCRLYPVKAFGPECVPEGSIMIVNDKSLLASFWFIAYKT